MSTSEEEKRARDEERRLNKEKARLERPPFKTTATVTHPKTIDALRGWKPPLRAYVLLERIGYGIVAEGEYEESRSLVTIDVEGRPEQIGKIQSYARKGFKVIHYGNFPRLNDSDSKRQRRAVLYAGPNGENPWDALATECDRMMSDGDPKMRAQLDNMAATLESKDDEIRSLHARIADMAAKNERNNGKGKGVGGGEGAPSGADKA